jgi:double-GTPase-like protein
MDGVTAGLYKCNQSDCSMGTDGRCVNGLSDCPNKIKVTLDDPLPDTEIQNDLTLHKAVLPIPWGENFTDDNLSTITYKYNSKLILLVGEPSSGKSTLYAALFDSFHKGACGSYYFTSTKTPIGFEEICHLAREKSKGRTPRTERTKSYEFTYFHIAVRLQDLTQPEEHIIFADVNGERFQDAMNSDDDVLKLSVMKRADQIFFIADGGLLIDNNERHVVKDNVWRMIKRCLQNNMIGSNQQVFIIVTKWDEISAAGKTKEVNDFFISKTLNEFKHTIKKELRVASRSMIDAVPPRTGIDEFLKMCLTPRSIPESENYIPIIKRQFQKFKYELPR